MSNKQQKMVDFLLKESDRITIDKIVSECKISKRSVYNYLDNLKTNELYILDINKNGITLKQKNKTYKSKIPQDYEERKRFIFRKGLIRQRPMKKENLLNYFQISESTFHSELIKTRREIAHYHIRLVEKDGELCFVGNYHDLKKLTQSIIYQENNNQQSLLSIENLTEIFPELDVEFVREILLKELNNSNYFMDEYSLLNLLLHILISTNQEMNGVIPINEIENDDVDETIEKICNTLENHYNFKFSNSAKMQFTLLLKTRKKNDEQVKENVYKNAETKQLVDKIFEMLNANYNIDMRTSELNYSFMMHVDNLLTRLKNGISVNNPMLSIIKRTSPITYDLAVAAANIICDDLDFKVSESEIAYIALHLGTRIEEIKSLHSRLKAVVVCPEFYSHNSPLIKIVGLYKEDLYISNVYTSFDYISDKDIDLIICTVEPSIIIENIKILQISNFLTSTDRNNIAKTIAKIKIDNKKKRDKESISSVFKKDLFFSDISFENRDIAIDYLSNNLKKNDYVDDEYLVSVKKREEIAPTDFGLIAIPHPAEYNAKQTVISVCLLDKPVLWERNKVTIIMMIAINGKDFSMFDDIFSSLCEIANEPNNVNKLHVCKTYKEFMETLIALMYTRES